MVEKKRPLLREHRKDEIIWTGDGWRRGFEATLNFKLPCGAEFRLEVRPTSSKKNATLPGQGRSRQKGLGGRSGRISQRCLRPVKGVGGTLCKRSYLWRAGHVELNRFALRNGGEFTVTKNMLRAGDLRTDGFLSGGPVQWERTLSRRNL